MELFKPLPRRGKFTSHFKVADVLDKGTGLVKVYNGEVWKILLLTLVKASRANYDCYRYKIELNSDGFFFCKECNTNNINLD